MIYEKNYFGDRVPLSWPELGTVQPQLVVVIIVIVNSTLIVL